MIWVPWTEGSCPWTSGWGFLGLKDLGSREGARELNLSGKRGAVTSASQGQFSEEHLEAAGLFVTFQR